MLIHTWYVWPFRKISKICCIKILSLHKIRQVKGHSWSGFPARGHSVRTGSLCCVYQGLWSCSLRKKWSQNSSTALEGGAVFSSGGAELRSTFFSVLASIEKLLWFQVFTTNFKAVFIGRLPLEYPFSLVIMSIIHEEKLILTFYPELNWNR